MLGATRQKERVAALAVGWMNPGLYYLVLFAAYDQLPAQEAMAINYSWGITLALIAAPLLGQKLTLSALLATVSYRASLSSPREVCLVTRASATRWHRFGALQHLNMEPLLGH